MFRMTVFRDDSCVNCITFIYIYASKSVIKDHLSFISFKRRRQFSSVQSINTNFHIASILILIVNIRIKNFSRCYISSRFRNISRLIYLKTWYYRIHTSYSVVIPKSYLHPLKHKKTTSCPINEFGLFYIPTISSTLIKNPLFIIIIFCHK